jgi:hypothetical protein
MRGSLRSAMRRFANMENMENIKKNPSSLEAVACNDAKIIPNLPRNFFFLFSIFHTCKPPYGAARFPPVTIITEKSKIFVNDAVFL